MSYALSYWSVLAAVLVLAVLPGYLFSRFFRGLDQLERLSVSFGFSFLAIGLLSLSSASSPPQLWAALFLGLVLAIAAYLFLWRKHEASHPELGFLVCVFIAQVVLKSLVQILWEYPSEGGDWFIHAFKIPLSFSIGDWLPPTERPPLFSMLILGFHSLLGTTLYSYWISQLVSVVANSALVVPAFLLAYTVFGRKVARATVLFLSINPFFFEQAIYTWPKNLAAYFILLTIYFLFFRQEKSRTNDALAGVFAAAAYLAHPLSVFYVFAALGGLAIQRRLFTRGTLYLAALMGLTLLPYFVWLYQSYGTISTSSMMVYPLMTMDWTQITRQTPEEIRATFWSTPWWRIMANRLFNVVSTLTELLMRHPVWSFLDTFPGALTLPVYVLAFVGVAKGLMRRSQETSTLLLFVFFPFVCLLLFWGWAWRGLVGQGLHVSAVLLTIMAFRELFRITDAGFRKVVGLTVILYVLVQAVSVGYHIDRFYQESLKSVYFSELGRSWHYVPDFDITRLVSAHFFLAERSALIVSFVLVAAVIALLATALLRSEAGRDDRIALQRALRWRSSGGSASES